MNKTTPFIFNDHIYYAGTIVQIKDEWKQNFKFNSILKFIGYDANENAYCFATLQDNWTIYKLSNEQIKSCIKNILKDENINMEYKRMAPKYVEDIVSGWIWYILIMFFAIFLKSIENVIGVWLIVTFLFFDWRHRRIKGGGKI